MLTLHHAHPWDLSLAEAKAVQESLRDKVIAQDHLEAIRYVAGVDVGFEENGATTRAAIAVLQFPELRLVETAIARRPTSFPYVPGFLSFREIPAVLDALEQVRQWPDLLLCDGQGQAHPRRLGIACHLGVLTDLPAIGVGKSRLVGTHPEVPDERGAWVPLVDRGEVIGAVLRSRAKTKPLYISVGHRISLPTALEYVMACTPKYRLPETTRQAHKHASGLI